MADNYEMLSITIHRQLSDLVRHVHTLLDRVQTAAASDEIELYMTRIKQLLDDIQETIGIGPTGVFDTFARHLYWMQKYHLQGKPDRYASDIDDIKKRDLPGVIRVVEEWGQRLLNPGLMYAITESWSAQHYDNAVRDAFIYLEDVLREAGNIDPSRGLSGDRLVTHLLASSSSERLTLSQDGFMGHLTSGERDGVYHYFKGAFLLFRNATAHRRIQYTASEAEDVIHVVNVCLRMLPADPHKEQF